MSDNEISDIKRDRSRSPVGGGDDNDRDRSRRMDRKPMNKPRSSGRRAPASHRIYVSNIPYEYKWQDLKDLFRNEIGEVNYVELFKDDTGRPRGCGIIEFETAELAQKAIDNMHRYELAGRKLVVKEQDIDIDRDNQGRLRKDMGGRSMNMSGGGGGGGGNYSSQGRMGGGSAGPNMSGPVNFGNTYGLSVVFLESLGINGPLVNKVFVANLDYSVDDIQLREVFKVAGKVVNVEISKDQESSKSRGFGVVEYEHPVEAVQAISMLNGQLYFERKMSVRMDRAQENKKGDSGAGGKLPQGLKGLGMGLGINGSALTDVSSESLSTNAAPAIVPTNTNLGSSIAAMNSMAPTNTMAMGNTSMPINAMAAANMGQGMNTNMAMQQNMGGMSGMTGGMSSGMMGMGSNAVDTSMNTNNMMGGGSGMMGAGNMMGGGGLGAQVAGINRMAAQGFAGNYGTAASSNDMNTNTNFSSNFGGGGGGTVGGTGNVVQISNLPMETTWQNLRDLCREYGEIRFAEIRRKGTGAVKFHSESDARRAVDMLDRQRFSGRLLEARIM